MNTHMRGIIKMKFLLLVSCGMLCCLSTTAQAATPKAGAAFRDCQDVCPELVVIPAGKFVMGSPETEGNRGDNEGPTRMVTIRKSFAMGKYMVTRAEFAQFVTATARPDPDGCFSEERIGQGKFYAGQSFRKLAFEQADSHPVVCVSWDDAKDYAGWLSKRTGKHYRLASEAEWEYAARAGTSGPRFWGDNPLDACTYANVRQLGRNENPDGKIPDCNDGYYFTSPVGIFKPNPFGLYDMLGNALEWVEDCFNYDYEGAPTDERPWLEGICEERMQRGAGYFAGADSTRVAFRSWGATNVRVSRSGFRIVRDL